MTSSPTLRGRRLISWSLRASSLSGRLRRAFSAPQRKRFLPLLNLGDGQAVPTGRLIRGGLDTQDLQHQVDSALGGSALEGLVVTCLFITHQLHLVI